MSDIHACRTDKQVKHLYSLFQSVFEEENDPSKMPEWNLTEQDIERVKEDIRPLNEMVCAKRPASSYNEQSPTQTELRALREQLASLS
jgi:hypothetical protein